MNLSGYLPAMRWLAESEMADAGKALGPLGRTYDPDLQAEVDTYADLFAAPCKIQARDVAPREEEVGARTATTVRHELHLPTYTDPLAVGDVWEVTDVHPLSTAVLGARYRVLAPVGKTFATARRYEVEEVAS